MADQKVATKREKLKAQLSALDDELGGYKARLAALKSGGTDRLEAKQLESRVKAVVEEQKRVSALLGKKSKDVDEDEDDDVQDDEDKGSDAA